MTTHACYLCGVELERTAFVCDECRAKQEEKRKEVQRKVNERLRKAAERLKSWWRNEGSGVL
jgi:predicted metal-binding protein